MDKNCSVPLPINFNCWKHHAGFLKAQIRAIALQKNINELNKHLLKIGESQMDLYFGNFSPVDISKQITSFLMKQKLFSEVPFKNWLRTEGNYQEASIEDKSTWILRLGENKTRYLHIHPGRHSPNTIRVKANTLKTAILILYFIQIGELKTIDTKSINKIRKNFLNEPPIKEFKNTSALKRILSFLG